MGPKLTLQTFLIFLHKVTTAQRLKIELHDFFGGRGNLVFQVLSNINDFLHEGWENLFFKCLDQKGPKISSKTIFFKFNRKSLQGTLRIFHVKL